MFKNRPRLELIVTETEWHAYGNPSSAWLKFLFETLTRMGGVSDTVQPGVYEFWITIEKFKTMTHLEPKV